MKIELKGPQASKSEESKEIERVWIKIFENFMNIDDAFLKHTYMPLGMVRKEIQDSFQNNDLLKHIYGMREYTKIAFLQMLLGGIVLILRFNVNVHRTLKMDFCDLDPNSDDRKENRIRLTIYTGFLIFIHFVLWVLYACTWNSSSI